MNISLRQLKAFLAVAHLGSFVEASRSIHVTPAALSVLIRELESVLGFRVFDRTTRRVALSSAGEQFFEHAERIQSELRMAERFAEDMRMQRTGVVRVAVTPLMACVLLPMVLREFRRLWPKVRIDLIDVASHDMVRAVEDGRVDLALSFATPTGAAIEATPVFTSMVHAIVPVDHPFAHADEVNWADLRDEYVVFIGQGSEIRIRAELPPGIHLGSSLEVGNSIVALGMAASGAGVTICSGYVWPLCPSQGLKAIRLVQPLAERKFVLYRRRHKVLSSAAQTFQDHWVEHFSVLGGQPVESSLAMGPLGIGLRAPAPLAHCPDGAGSGNDVRARADGQELAVGAAKFHAGGGDA